MKYDMLFKDCYLNRVIPVLTFASEFPVALETCEEQLPNVVCEWLRGSPHVDFSEDQLYEIRVGSSLKIQSGNETVERITLPASDCDAERAQAFRRTLVDNDIEWTTDIVLSINRDAWISIKTSRHSSIPMATLPNAKKPIIVNYIINTMGGQYDGMLKLSKNAHFLSNNDIDLAENIINDTSSGYLPIIYISIGHNDRFVIEPNSLANDLSGMAHVVAEPNRAFSQRLKIAVDSENVYGGAIGIYWPDADGQRQTYVISDYPNTRSLKQAIIAGVRHALANRRPLYRCTWGAVEQISSRRALTELKRSGSIEIDEYTKSFDVVIEATKTKLETAEAEINKLKNEIRDLRKKRGTSLQINSISEIEFFDGEINNIIRDALQQSLNTTLEGSRRRHIIQAAIESLKPSSQTIDRRDSIKALLKGYKSLDKKIENGLLNFGFSITNDGKHYKLVYNNDPRYTFTLPKSGSDHRGGLNIASDIAKVLF